MKSNQKLRAVLRELRDMALLEREVKTSPASRMVWAEVVNFADRTAARHKIDLSMTNAGQWFSFFMRSGEIEEVWATDKEAALKTLGQRIGKSRYWTRAEIETCLTRENNQARLERQGKIFNHSGRCGRIITNANRKGKS